jgi:hypothetical protein
MPTIETSDNSFTPVILIVGSAFESKRKSLTFLFDFQKMINAMIVETE